MPTQKQKPTFVLVHASDGKRFLDLLSADLASRGTVVLQNVKNPKPDVRGTFTIVLLTANFKIAHLAGISWTQNIPADSFYVWADDKNLRISGPWEANGSHGVVVAYENDEEKIRSQIRDYLDDYTQYCDTCGQLCRDKGGAIRHYKGKSTKPVKVTCRECDLNELVETFLRTDELTSWLLEQTDRVAVFQRQVALTLKRQAKSLNSKASDFSTQVWISGGVQAYYIKSDNHGHSLQVSKHVHALMWGSAGRVMITIQNTKSGSYVSYLGYDEPSTSGMYLRGIGASAQEAIEMTDMTIRAIKQGKKFQPDNEVHYL